MNRRNFLTGFLKGAIAVAAAPQIVTHGLGLKLSPDYVEIVTPFEYPFLPTPLKMELIYRFKKTGGFIGYRQRNVIQENGVWRLDTQSPIIENRGWPIGFSFDETNKEVTPFLCDLSLRLEDGKMVTKNGPEKQDIMTFGQTLISWQKS
jgi:hypothetical protein